MTSPVRRFGSKRPIDMLGTRVGRMPSSILLASWERDFLREIFLADLIGHYSLKPFQRF
ncbi:hypothetical protein [Pseudomonas sp. PvR086]